MTWQKTCLKLIFLTIILCSMLISVADTGGEDGSLLKRRKRYVVFPEGSSFSIALCLTVHTLTPDNIFTEGVNWGISYDLPNESKPELEPFLQLRRDKIKINKYKASINHKQQHQQQHQFYDDKTAGLYSKEKYNKFSSSNYNDYKKADYHYLQRRYRRNLYNKLEVIINAIGQDGRTCVLRALCEAAQRFVPRGKGLVEEMIRLVFTLPVRGMFPFEPEEHHAYARAHRAGQEAQNCVDAFPDCGFSLIDMALGKYNQPAANSLHKPEDDPSSSSSSFDSSPAHTEIFAARLATGFSPSMRYYTMK